MGSIVPKTTNQPVNVLYDGSCWDNYPGNRRELACNKAYRGINYTLCQLFMKVYE
jgi:hypothetical protein